MKSTLLLAVFLLTTVYHISAYSVVIDKRNSSASQIKLILPREQHLEALYPPTGYQFTKCYLFIIRYKTQEEIVITTPRLVVYDNSKQEGTIYDIETGRGQAKIRNREHLRVETNDFKQFTFFPSTSNVALFNGPTYDDATFQPIEEEAHQEQIPLADNKTLTDGQNQEFTETLPYCCFGILLKCGCKTNEARLQ